MTLTLPLGQKIHGDKLIDIVEAGMNEVKDHGFGWKVVRKKGKKHGIVHMNKFTPCVLTVPNIENNPIEYDMALNTKEKPCNVFLSLQRYGGYGRGQALGFSHCTPLEWILITPLIFSDRDTYRALFATNDSIFTFLDPNQSHSEIIFYANAAYTPSGKECGRADGKDSPQFQKIKPAYNEFVQNILKKMPMGHPYR